VKAFQASPDFRHVLKVNSRANDLLSGKYAATWSDDIQKDVVFKFLEAMPKAAPSDYILDLACGPGNYISALSRSGNIVVGLDLSAGMLSCAKHSSSLLIRGDASALPFADAAFLGVWFSAGLVHVPQFRLDQTTLGIARILVTTGVLYISYQLGDGLEEQEDGRIFFYFNEVEVDRSLALAGFEVLTRWSNVTTKSTSGKLRTKRWMHFIARKL
jgi:ubiquinone/menaquinone biosynthesis C-methylase UbiE